MNMTERVCTLEPLTFDTEIFGIKCGRVEIKNNSLSRNELKCILEEAKGQQIKHVVAEVPSEWVEICNLLEDHKFRLKMCSLSMEKELSQSVDKMEDVVVYDGTENCRLIKITEKAFSSSTRFHYEQKFSSAQIIKLHKRWITNLINDQDVQIYVHLDNTVITGYVTVKIEDGIKKKGHIGLFAVDKDLRGMGIGTKLLSALNSKLFGKVDTLGVITESINYAALKIYINGGFSINKSWNIFHLSFK
jgi:ribosomal protein S18 acetylase RimI-like enzyme